MGVTEDTQAVQSSLGCIATVFVTVLIVLYAIQKTEILLRRRDMNIRQFTKKHHFPDDHRFSYENGFNIAVAFTGFDDIQEWDLDPSVGELQFRASEWGNNPDGSFYWDHKVLKSHKCSDEELGLAPDRKGARFMPAVDRHLFYIDYYKEKFICLDPDDLYFFGDFESPSARQLNIDLVKCKGNDSCKNETEV